MSNKIDKIVCINLKFRKDRKTFMKRQSRKKNIPNISFYKAIYDKQNGARGCLLSHLNIIKDAKKKNLKNILIIEDDCKFLQNFKLPNFPENYEMLYLGGNVAEIFEKMTPWSKVSVWTTHSYIMNSSIFDLVIESLQNYEQPIDKFYKQHIHINMNSYILNPVLTTQKEGYSDIEKRHMDYTYMNTIEDIVDIEFAEHEIKDEGYILKLDDITDNELPFVSILTPTYNRRQFFKLAINNFNSFIYPRDKLEWVIIDDGDENIKDLLPIDNSIKYVHLKANKPLPISMKRNLCVKYAKYDFLVHMDDDDYYPPCSILSRIKILLQNPYKQCVGSIKLGCLDIINNTCFTVDGANLLSEASLGYTRHFFDEVKFNEKVLTGEGKLFIQGRQKYCLQIPYVFILISLSHKKNITNELRITDKQKGNNINNPFNIDENTLNIIKNI